MFEVSLLYLPLILIQLLLIVITAAFVAKLLILGVSPLTSFIFVLREGLRAKLATSGILPLIFFNLSIIYANIHLF